MVSANGTGSKALPKRRPAIPLGYLGWMNETFELPPDLATALRTEIVVRRLNPKPEPAPARPYKGYVLDGGEWETHFDGGFPPGPVDEAMAAKGYLPAVQFGDDTDKVQLSVYADRMGSFACLLTVGNRSVLTECVSLPDVFRYVREAGTLLRLAGSRLGMRTP